MSAILSDNFRFYNLENFISSVSSNSIYMFIGRSQSWDSENNPPTPIDNFAYLNDVYDQIIALKKISISNLIPVIKRINWTSGITYDMYRPDYTTGNTEYIGTGNTNSGLRYPTKISTNGYNTLNYGAQFYVMNEFYQVYKCLYNGQSPTNPYGIPSTVEPVGISNSPITTSDGYRWKYLYTIPTYYVLNFINDYYIPVPYPGLAFSPEVSVTNSAIPGGIDTAVVLQSGTGYNNGTYINVPISGDGVGATANIVISGGQITNVSITNSGSGYSFASINLNSLGLGAGSGGSIEVIVSPKYGHGSNPYLELGAYKLMIHSNLLYNETQFPQDCSYRRIGLITNPYRKGTTTIATDSNINQLNSITFSSVSGNFKVGEYINQNITNAVGRVVSWDSTNKILKYYQDRFDGVYNQNLVPFSGNGLITGFETGVTGTPSTYSQSGIEKNTGKIIYIDNRNAVSRSANQTEDIKIVVEF